MDPGSGGLPRVRVGERPTVLVRYEGSFFGLRAAVEPIVAQDRPEALLVYLPGVSRDRQGSVLMELEKGGTCYEPQLKRLALNVLRKHFTDGQIDEMLRPATSPTTTSWPSCTKVTKAVGLRAAHPLCRCRQRGAAHPLARRPQQDAAIVDKDATAELYKLIASRLGLAVPDGTPVTEARDKTLRYVLVNEFRAGSGLRAAGIDQHGATPPTKEHVERIRDVAARLRRDFAERYVELADRVATDLGSARTRRSMRHTSARSTHSALRNSACSATPAP